MITIYHNNTCSKSNKVLTILTETGLPFKVINYLESPPSFNELKVIIDKLGLSAHDLIRKGEPLYVSDYANLELSEDEWMEVMIKHPILIERPIVVTDTQVLVARPPEKVIELLY